MTWREFRKTLVPKYFVVWRDIVLIHAAVWSGYTGALLTDFLLAVGWAMALLPVWAAWIGFWLLALLSFGHESAHDNLASNRVWSDRLANWFVWPLYGQSAAQYRRTHWQHHLNLGNPHDTEVSYHHCLSPWFVIQTLTGLHLVAAFVRHLRNMRRTSARSTDRVESLFQVSPKSDGLHHSEEGQPENDSHLLHVRDASRSLSELWPVARSAIIHLSLVGAAMWAGLWIGALTWCVAVGMVFPFLATIRQLVEHRRIDAGCDRDFAHETHGPVNRLFGTGLFSRCFGAAGFNRHLLHHWDPRISYTRFDDMESFLQRTPVESELDAQRTTYWQAIRDLLRSARRG